MGGRSKDRKPDTQYPRDTSKQRNRRCSGSSTADEGFVGSAATGRMKIRAPNAPSSSVTVSPHRPYLPSRPLHLLRHPKIVVLPVLLV